MFARARGRSRAPGTYHSASSSGGSIRTLDLRTRRSLARKTQLILIRREGYSSSLAAIRLHELGLVKTTDVIGGFAAWVAAGLRSSAEADQRAVISEERRKKMVAAHSGRRRNPRPGRTPDR